jgi:hypothetical protein
MSEGICFVYLIATVQNGAPSAPVKIGISANPMVRLAELQTGSPFRLMLLGMLATPSRQVAREAEKWIHFCHPDKALHGEWFDIEPFSAVSTLGYFVHDHFHENKIGIENWPRPQTDTAQ